MKKSSLNIMEAYYIVQNLSSIIQSWSYSLRLMFSYSSSRIQKVKAGTCRNAYAGGQEGQLPPLPSSMGGTGGARIALHTEFFPSLLSSKGAFSGILGSLVQENFSQGKPSDPYVAIDSLRD